MSGNEQFYTRECQQTLAISIQIIGIYIRLFSLEKKKRKKTKLIPRVSSIDRCKNFPQYYQDYYYYILNKTEFYILYFRFIYMDMYIVSCVPPR